MPNPQTPRTTRNGAADAVTQSYDVLWQTLRFCLDAQRSALSMFARLSTAGTRSLFNGLDRSTEPAERANPAKPVVRRSVTESPVVAKPATKRSAATKVAAAKRPVEASETKRPAAKVAVTKRPAKAPAKRSVGTKAATKRPVTASTAKRPVKASAARRPAGAKAVAAKRQR